MPPAPPMRLRPGTAGSSLAGLLVGAVVAVVLILMPTIPENDEAPAETADQPTGEALDSGPLNE